MESIQETAEKIRKLEIQGARNAAIAAIKTIEVLAKHTKAKNKTEFLKELANAKEILFATRETEPLMRNAIRWILNRVDKNNSKKVKDIAKTVSSSANQFLNNLERSREEIATIGANRIRNGSVIFTHCHSSTVTYMLQKAKQQGKIFEVICTETRPVFQGRKTAK